LEYDSSPRASACVRRWQPAECARHAHVLARCPGREADPPRQPLGARAKAVSPAAAGVELTDQLEEACGGGVEVRGELGDLVAESFELELALRCGLKARQRQCRLSGTRPR
jgi:hypothetical protein